VVPSTWNRFFPTSYRSSPRDPPKRGLICRSLRITREAPGVFFKTVSFSPTAHWSCWGLFDLADFQAKVRFPAVFSQLIPCLPALPSQL